MNVQFLLWIIAAASMTVSTVFLFFTLLEYNNLRKNERLRVIERQRLIDSLTEYGYALRNIKRKSEKVNWQKEGF